ncbi:EboA domain-containing protein [Microbacterium sp. KSW4-17]|uniref:EboA domain-containing protein n=1 Tax=Microbacterium galbum TaxID=3075994 RepID=A0ABU3T7C9_9MICO|nr:EboA domain-containing protein [Microbacterium sp. KSW4-17]MDU0367256.1 EboA domain-containing protein [Microbacterium sp. KSW4-17]
MSVDWTWGYGTNGFTDHPLPSALDVLQHHGYRAVALTLGHPHLDPFAADWREQTEALAVDLRRRGLRVVVETGTRYLLDAFRKHRPTLVDREAGPRMDFLRRAIEIAAILDADCVSLWSGVVPGDVSTEAARVLLDERLLALTADAAAAGVTLALEPEPGMLVETVADALAVRARLGHPAALGVTVDLGHCVVVEPDGVVGALRAAGSLLCNVQADDMLPSAHEHLPFGDGELDLPAALAVLREIGYRGVVAVELPRHAHAAPELARASMAALLAASETPRPTVAAGPNAGGAVAPGRPSALPTPVPHPWTTRAVEAVQTDAARAARLFASAGREVGREPLSPEPFAPTADDVSRAAIVAALADSGADPDVVRALYRRGDDAERRGVLRGLDALAAPSPGWREAGLELVVDALRANDTRLVAAALGRFAAAHLDDHAWRHGVLKCVFLGIPLVVVAGLAERADDELAAMGARFAEERRAAGRSVPADLALLSRSTDHLLAERA